MMLDHHTLLILIFLYNFILFKIKNQFFLNIFQNIMMLDHHTLLCLVFSYNFNYNKKLIF